MVGDIYDIEKRIKSEVDEELSVDFDYDREEYAVFHKGYLVMFWPMPLDSRLLDHMKRIDVRRGYDPLKEIDEHNEKLDLTQQKDRFNHFESVVKYYHPRMRNEIDGMSLKTVF